MDCASASRFQVARKKARFPGARRRETSSRAVCSGSVSKWESGVRDALGRTYTAGEPDDDFLIILVLFIDSWEEPEEHLVFFIGLVADWQKARV